MIAHVNKAKESIDRLNRLYPNRHKVIHKVACDGCPSEQDKKLGILDPESEEIKTFDKELIAKEFLFVCYKRNSRLCKGLCDNMGIDQQYLNELHELPPKQ